MGPFCVTRSKPTQPTTHTHTRLTAQPTTSGKIWTQPNTTHNGAYSLVVACFIHRTYLVLLVNQASTYSCSLLIIIHSLHVLKAVSLCHSKQALQKCSKCPQQQLSKLARRPHRASSVAGPNLTQPNPTHGSTQPMDNSGPAPMNS